MLDVITEVDRMASRRIAEGRWEEIRERIQQLMSTGLKHAKELKNTAVQMLQDEYGIDLSYAKILVAFFINEIEKKRKKLQRYNREGSKGHPTGRIGMTLKQAQEEVRGLGFVLVHDREWGQYIVKPPGQKEDDGSWYYANDLDDAVGTAKSMRRRQTESNGTAWSGRGASRRVAYKEDDILDLTKYLVKHGEKAAVGNREFIEAVKIAAQKRGTSVGKMFTTLRDWAANASGALSASSQRWSAGEAIDRVATHLENLGKAIPREASNFRGMALRLDRVSNTLEEEPWGKSHRELYPGQYSHPLVGKRVRVHGKEGVVERVVNSQFGQLAILKGGGNTAWAVEDCKPIGGK